MSFRNFSCIVDVSDDSLTESAWTVAVQDDNQAIWNGYTSAAYGLLLLLLGTPWNIFVIVTVLCKGLVRTPIVILMLNLTITNLMVCVFVLPFVIIAGSTQDFIFGSTDYTRCQVCALGVANIILPYNSIFTLCLMSADRFLYLKKPMQYSSLVTNRRMLDIIFITWTFLTVLSIPPFFGFGSINFAHVVLSCAPFSVGTSHLLPNFYYAIFLTTSGLIPFSVLIVMYIWIAVIAQKHILRRAAHIERNSIENLSSNASSDTSDNSQTYKCRQFQMIRLFLMIVSINILLWIPLLFLAITGAILGPNRIPTVLYSITYFSNITGIVIHPALQTLLIYELRKVSLLSILCSKMMS